MKLNFLYLLFLLFPTFLFGQFSSRKIVASTELSQPYAVRSADLDGDGDLDILFSDFSNNKIGWYENLNGQGEFGSLQIISTEIASAFGIFTADLDGDNDLDILSASINDDKIAWYENVDGQGNFGPQQILSTNADRAVDVSTGDLDGDGDLDVVSASIQDDKIAWYKNEDGLGDFSNEIKVDTTANGVRSLFLTDLDGDGDTDILAGINIDGILAWYENEDGLGNFGEKKIISDNAILIAMCTTSDVDGDGDQDALYVSLAEDKVAWFENLDGQGNFGSEQVISDNTNMVRSIQTDDVDGDGDFDVLIVSDSRIAWFENEDGQGSFGNMITIFSLDGGKNVYTGDLDGDGDIDALSTSSDDKKVAWYENEDGMGDFGTQKIVSIIINKPQSVFAADLDNDGDEDVITALEEDNSIVWYQNVNGVFQGQQIISTNAIIARVVQAGDMDGDGDIDVVATSQSGDKTAWYENIDGLGNFGPANILSTTFTGATDILVIDLDQDGDQDILTARSNITWFENEDGLGNFSAEQSITLSGVGATSVFAIDIDGDSDLDVLSAAEGIDEIAWYENMGDALSWGGQQIVTDNANHVTMVHAADLDGDGDNDLVAPFQYSDAIVWFRNEDGLGTFSNPISFPLTFIPVPNVAYAADMDNDGDNDIVMGTIDGTEVSWFENSDGLGNFNDNQAIGGNGSITSLHLSDIDNDDDLDIFITTNLDEVVWFENLFDKPQISGTVYWDLNEDGIFDSNEIPLNNQNLNLEPDALDTWTNQQGAFSYFVLPNDYTLTIDPTLEWMPTSPASVNIIVDNSVPVVTQNFGLKPTNPMNEVEVDLTSGPLRCNNPVPFYLNLKNIGNEITSGTVTLLLDTLTTYENAVPTPTIISDSLLTWDYEDLIPSYDNQYFVVLNMPGVDQIGSILHLKVKGNIFDGSNNIIFTDTFNFAEELTCAYDPNDKLVTPNIIGQPNYTLFTDIFNYTIRFQNTGNDTAFLVRLEDQLDPNLDWPTFRPLASSHDYQVFLDSYGKLEFIFENILLPDSTTNLLGSQGFVKFEIQQKPNLPEQTIIQNNANIFFDFNPPILTNTTENILISSFDTDGDGFDFFTDCDDNNFNINPDATEVPYNGLDDDCNPLTVDDDIDGDGFLLADDCDDNNIDINPDAFEVPYNGIDEDCNPLTLDDDLDGDGFLFADDCDDNNMDINPDATEIPYNGIDEDCNPLTLDDDLDGDGFLITDDCDDDNMDINPDAIEIPNNGIDEDCDGIDLIVSNKDIEELSLQVFPNPASDKIYLILPEEIPIGILEIRDLSGKIILTTEVRQEESIDIHHFINGVYLLEVKTAEYFWVKKIVKF